MRQVYGEESWRNTLTEAVREGSAAHLLQVMTQELACLSGTPGQALKRNAVQIIEAAAGYDSSALLRIAESLADSGCEPGEEIAVFLLPVHYAASPVCASGLLKKLVCSPFASVRELTADACGAVLSKHFQSFYSELELWVNDGSPFVRRAVVIAVKYASNMKNPAWGAKLLNLVEPLLRDNDAIVKKELGPHTLGGGLLRHYSREIAARMQQWTRSEDPTVRLHAAKLFTSPEAANHLDDLGPALHILLQDPSAQVHKTAVSALRHLSKRLQDPSPLLKLGAV